MAAGALFFLDLDEALADVPLLRAWLTPQERCRLDAIARPVLRRQWGAARALLRYALERHLPGDARCAQIAYDARGKPFLPEWPDWSISVSHTPAMVACALGRVGALGVDIEAHARRLPAPPNWARFRAPSELDYVAGSPIRFLEVWVGKEAVLKADGAGLSGGMRAVRLAPDRQGRLVVAAAPVPPAGMVWQLEGGCTGAHVWALARWRRADGPADAPGAALAQGGRAPARLQRRIRIFPCRDVAPLRSPPPQGERRGLANLVARGKFDAWKELNDMPTDTAMRLFPDLLAAGGKQ
jgi:4'-phosphopantetheinyl transferase